MDSYSIWCYSLLLFLIISSWFQPVGAFSGSLLWPWMCLHYSWALVYDIARWPGIALYFPCPALDSVIASRSPFKGELYLVNKIWVLGILNTDTHAWEEAGKCSYSRQHTGEDNWKKRRHLHWALKEQQRKTKEGFPNNRSVFMKSTELVMWRSQNWCWKDQTCLKEQEQTKLSGKLTVSFVPPTLNAHKISKLCSWG